MLDTSLDIATLGGCTMGTRWSVKLVAARQRALHPLHGGIQAQLDGVVAQMSTWEPGSDISRYNRAEAGSWHDLPDEFFHVLQRAQDIARCSGGTFDTTIGPLVALWGFGANAQAVRVPEPATLAGIGERCGWQRLLLRPTQQQALQPGGLHLDLSAIAKGFGVDQVSRWLRAVGIEAALVEVGGELYGYGRKPDGQPWRVLVEAGPDEDALNDVPPRVLALEGLAVATSGDRWHHHDIDGQRYSHTLDPRSRLPVPHSTAAVTVVAAETMDADAWATALTVMGAGEGLAFATTHGIAARFISRSPAGIEETISPAFQHHLDASHA